MPSPNSLSYSRRILFLCAEPVTMALSSPSGGALFDGRSEMAPTAVLTFVCSDDRVTAEVGRAHSLVVGGCFLVTRVLCSLLLSAWSKVQTGRTNSSSGVGSLPYFDIFNNRQTKIVQTWFTYIPGYHIDPWAQERAVWQSVVLTGSFRPTHDFVKFRGHWVFAIVIIAEPAMLRRDEVATNGLVGLL